MYPSFKLIVYFAKKDYCHSITNQNIEYKNQLHSKILSLKTQLVGKQDAFPYIKISKIDYYFNIMSNKNIFQSLKVISEITFVKIMRVKKVHV